MPLFDKEKLSFHERPHLQLVYMPRADERIDQSPLIFSDLETLQAFVDYMEGHVDTIFDDGYSAKHDVYDDEGCYAGTASGVATIYQDTVLNYDKSPIDSFDGDDLDPDAAFDRLNKSFDNDEGEGPCDFNPEFKSARKIKSLAELMRKVFAEQDIRTSKTEPPKITSETFTKHVTEMAKRHGDDYMSFCAELSEKYNHLLTKSEQFEMIGANSFLYKYCMKGSLAIAVDNGDFLF